MRAHKVLAFLAVCLAISFVTLCCGRQHIIELCQTLRTYLSFRHHLELHPEELFRHGNSTTSDETSWLIPPIIHHISLTDGPTASLQKYDTAVTSCTSLHNEWEHYFWTDETASAFVQQHYPELWPHYVGYRRTVQRANILRYALLDHFGGVYLDLDLTCLQPLNEMMHLPWLAPAAYPVGISNGFMMSRPSHPFTKFVLAHAPSSDLSWGLPYLETMLSTGCMFLSNQFMSYLYSSSGFSGAGSKAENRMYILADEVGNTEAHMLRGHVTTPLFRHEGSSSWHEWDAQIFILIGQHHWYFVSMFIFSAACSAARIWWCYRRGVASPQRYQQLINRREKAALKSSEAEDWLV